MFRARWSLVLLVVLVAAPAKAAEPFRYTEGKHGKGELKYVNDIPVLVVEGTPEEMGEQIGTLALKPSRGGVLGLFQQFLKDKGLDKAMPLILTGCKRLYQKFPEEHRKE